MQAFKFLFQTVKMQNKITPVLGTFIQHLYGRYISHLEHFSRKKKKENLCIYEQCKVFLPCKG